jgi:hypothetical protein
MSSFIAVFLGLTAVVAADTVVFFGAYFTG